MLIKTPPDATPIDDISGLIPTISTQEELNQREFANINKTVMKYFLGHLSEKKAPFTLGWLHQVHQEMYGEVWEWAGKPRQREFNIGIAALHIETSLKQLLDNLEYWQDKTNMEV